MEQGYMYNGWDEGCARIRSAGPDDEDDDDDEEDTHSDDGPLLHYNNEKCRRYPSHAQPERDRRRSTLGLVMKFTLFCTAMIMFCVLMYIPMYNKVIDHMPKDIVAGWTVHTNRDTKIYVQPYNVTTMFEPKGVCTSHNKKNKLFLLIVVCSSTNNFERRIAIRETWGNYQKYLEISKIYTKIKEKYKNYNFTYDLYPEPTVLSVNATQEINRTKRDVGFGLLLPKLAEALKKNLEQVRTEEVTEEKRFDDDNNGITDFDMNKELEKQIDNNEIDNYDYEESNVMRIPPNGDEDNPDLDKVISMLKKSNFKVKVKDENVESSKDIGHLDVEFKVAFLLGLPNNPKSNNSNVQMKIEEEVAKYGDVIQENFVDSYNNLTLKSIMMLKWVTHHCNGSLRYILKSDDDMYINMPNLMATLKNRSKEYEKKVQNGLKKPEYLLMGDLISGAKPVLDASNKWFSPRYMYSGRVYPRYLSGTAYALSAAAAAALYRAALNTPYFHLEDVYITGICALRSSPPITPTSAAGFSPRAPRRAPCHAHSAVTAHRVTPDAMRRLTEALLQPLHVDRCERMRLTQVRRDRLRPKVQPKKLTKFGKSISML